MARQIATRQTATAAEKALSRHTGSATPQRRFRVGNAPLPNGAAYKCNGRNFSMPPVLPGQDGRFDAHAWRNSAPGAISPTPAVEFAQSYEKAKIASPGRSKAMQAAEKAENRFGRSIAHRNTSAFHKIHQLCRRGKRRFLRRAPLDNDGLSPPFCDPQKFCEAFLLAVF